MICSSEGSVVDVVGYLSACVRPNLTVPMPMGETRMDLASVVVLASGVRRLSIAVNPRRVGVWRWAGLGGFGVGGLGF